MVAGDHADDHGRAVDAELGAQALPHLRTRPELVAVEAVRNHHGPGGLEADPLVLRGAETRVVDDRARRPRQRGAQPDEAAGQGRLAIEIVDRVPDVPDHRQGAAGHEPAEACRQVAVIHPALDQGRPHRAGGPDQAEHRRRQRAVLAHAQGDDRDAHGPDALAEPARAEQGQHRRREARAVTSREQTIEHHLRAPHRNVRNGVKDLHIRRRLRRIGALPPGRARIERRLLMHVQALLCHDLMRPTSWARAIARRGRRLAVSAAGSRAPRPVARRRAGPAAAGAAGVGRPARRAPAGGGQPTTP